MPIEYRLAPPMTVRLLGLSLMVLAGLVFVTAVVATLLRLPAWVFVVVALVGLVLVIATAAWLRRRVVVRLDDEGYRVRMVRGAGTREARWTEVTEVATTYAVGEPCALLRLDDGRTTTIPVNALAGDREAFIRELQEHLQRGHGLRRLEEEPGGDAPEA